MVLFTDKRDQNQFNIKKLMQKMDEMVEKNVKNHKNCKYTVICLNYYFFFFLNVFIIFFQTAL